MSKFNKTQISVLSVSLICLIAVLWLLSDKQRKDNDTPVLYSTILTDTISKITSGYPGEIGVALIINH